MPFPDLISQQWLKALVSPADRGAHAAPRGLTTPGMHSDLSVSVLAWTTPLVLGRPRSCSPDTDPKPRGLPPAPRARKAPSLARAPAEATRSPDVTQDTCPARGPPALLDELRHRS